MSVLLGPGFLSLNPAAELSLMPSVFYCSDWLPDFIFLICLGCVSPVALLFEDFVFIIFRLWSFNRGVTLLRGPRTWAVAH